MQVFRERSAIYAFLAAAISTSLGTIISFPFISKIDRSILGILLAISAGALVYVGASHLLPAVEKEQGKYTLVSLAGAILIAVLLLFQGLTKQVMKYVFGPVPSRRLGNSLGIDPIPLKTCNWNCVYCQLGEPAR